MKIKGIIVLSVFTASSLFSAQTITLNKLIKLTMEHSPDISISRLNVQSATERLHQAEGDRLPVVNLTAGITQIQTNSDIATDNFGRVGGKAGGGLASAVLSASQLVYDFGRTKGKVDARSHEYSAFDKEMRITIQRKVFSVRRDYFEILKSESAIRIQKENVKISKEQLNRAERYFKAGMKTNVDISNAQVILFDAKQSLKRAEYNKKLSITQLVKTVGYVPYRGEFHVAHKKVPMPTPSRNLPRSGTTLASLQNYALEHRYELQQQENLIQSAEALVKSQEADYYPTLTVDAAALAQSLDTDNPAIKLLYPDSSWQMGINAHWNLFEGFNTDSRVQEAKINKLRSMSSKQIVKLQIKKEVADSYFLLKQAKDIMQLSESLVKASKLKFNQIQRLYESDLADYLQLQDAQKDYVNSMTKLANSYYDYYIALALVDLSIGKEYRL